MKSMKKYAAAGAAVLLTGVLTVGSAMWSGAPYLTAAESDPDDKEKLVDAIEEVGTNTPAVSGGTELSKEETVYVTADASGNVTKVIVSDWLKNAGREASLSDVSDLKDIENVKGDETFTQDGNRLTWQTAGADIYYQGTTDKALPVSMDIRYELDGKQISPADLVGKSGTLSMTVSYTAADLPFTMITAMMLPVEHFQNVALDNGKIISDAKTDIAVGLAFPGLQDRLDLDSEDLEFPTSFTLTADVTDFQMGPTMTIATCGLLNDMDLDDFEGMDDLKDALNDLSDASTELVDGTGDLKEGVDKLQSKTGEFKDGVNTLNDGLNQLQDGAGTLKDGVNQYTDGADTLALGVNQYVDGANTLASGASQYVDGTNRLAGGVTQYVEGATALSTGVKQYVEGSKSVAEGIDQLNQALSGLNISEEDLNTLNALVTLAGGLDDDTLNQLRGMSGSINGRIDQYNEQLQQALDSALSQSLSGNLTPAILDSIDPTGAMPQDQKDALAASINSGISQTVTGTLNTVFQSDPASPLKDKVTAAGTTLNGLADNLGSMKSGMDTVKPLLSQLPNLQQLPGVVGQIKGGMDQLSEKNDILTGGADALLQSSPDLKSGAKELTDKSADLKNGASALTGKSGELKNGANTLSGKSGELRDGVNSLASASDQLKDGGNTLSKGTNALADGIGTLADGAKDLNSGMKEFDETGIQKLKSTFDDDIQGLLDRVDDISQESKAYKSFSGIRDDMNGSVKFIIETAEIK